MFHAVPCSCWGCWGCFIGGYFQHLWWMKNPLSGSSLEMKPCKSEKMRHSDWGKTNSALAATGRAMMQQGCSSSSISSLVTKILPRNVEILFDFMKPDCDPSDAGASNSVLPFPIWTICGLHSHCYWCQLWHLSKVRESQQTTLSHNGKPAIMLVIKQSKLEKHLGKVWLFQKLHSYFVLSQAQDKIPYIHWEVIRCKVFPYQIIFNLFSQVDFLVSNTVLT